MSFHPLVTISVRRKVAEELRNRGDSFLTSVIKANRLSKSTINETVSVQLQKAQLAAPIEFGVDVLNLPQEVTLHHDGLSPEVAAAGPILQSIIDFFTAHPEIMQLIVTVLIALL